MTEFNPVKSIANFFIDFFGFTSDVAVGSSVLFAIFICFAALFALAAVIATIVEIRS